MSESGAEAAVEELERLVAEGKPESLVRAAGDSALNEQLARLLLARRDLPRKAVEALARNTALSKCRAVLVGIVQHQNSPRRLTLSIMRRLFPFELLAVASTPSVPADVRRRAEDALVARLGTTTVGERVTLAKCATTRIPGALLRDEDERVTTAALLNPRLTESEVVLALRRTPTDGLRRAVAVEEKWRYREEVRAALEAASQSDDSNQQPDDDQSGSDT